MRKGKIEGTWWDFQHQNLPEGKYYNEALARFSAADWARQVTEAAGIGMEYFVLMSVAIESKAFYDTPLLPKFGIACDDPIEAVLSAADSCGGKFFIGNDYFDDAWDWHRDIMDPETCRKRTQSMEEITARYGHHPSFHGWYWPIELYLKDGIPDYYAKYVNEFAARARAITPKAKTLIAPYGTGVVVPDDNYVRQLEALDVDVIAYQDEIGCLRHGLDDLPRIYEGLRKVHDRVPKIAFWADVEIFEFEGDVGKSALLPAPFPRVKTQLEAAAAFVDRILVYEYQGMMAKPGSPVFAGHPTAATLYTDYVTWLGEATPTS